MLLFLAFADSYGMKYEFVPHALNVDISDLSILRHLVPLQAKITHDTPAGITSALAMAYQFITCIMAAPGRP